MIKINARSPFFLQTDAESVPPPTAPTQTIQVQCGDTYNTSTDVGNTIYEVSTPETGTMEIEVTGNDVPVKFVVEWDGVDQVDTGYIGLDLYDQELLNAGVSAGEINTANPSNKTTTLSFNKTTSTPELVKIKAIAPLVNDQYSLTFNCPQPQAIVIEQTTQINIWFDSSGSMNSTLSPLNSMVSGNLKNCLIQFYNNDGAEYDKYVQVRNFSDERTFNVASSEPDVAGATNVINIVFQDEASPVYYSAIFNAATYKAQYQADITKMRNIFANNQVGYVTPIIFQVDYESSGVENFKEFLKAVRDGSGVYTGNLALTDYSDRIKFYFNLEDGVSYSNDPTYYRDFIVQAINDLGFTLNCP